jgi:hypothetical protein
MPIRRFLDGQAFEPEMINTMSDVLVSVCAELGLTMKDDPATRHVAAKIIELAQRGVHNSARLRMIAIEEIQDKSGN